MNIALIGMMGSGKTTIGKLLSEKLPEFTFIDTDSEIVKQEKNSVNEIFDKKGEAYFRTAETLVLKKVLENDFQIISTGGGIIKSDENISLLKDKSVVIYLKANSDTLFERVKNNNERPLLNVDNMFEKIDKLLKERTCNYEKAHYIIDTNNKQPDTIVKEITEIINDYGRS